MKLALLGDIHGNHLALQAILTEAKASGVETLLITGDLVGYYHYPLQVLELLSPWHTYIVRGNHEDMLKAARTDPEFLTQVDSRYGIGLRTAIEQLDKKQLDTLCELPHPLELIIDECRILLCHGSPRNINQYIYPDAKQELLDSLASLDFDLIVLGHTHYSMCHKIEGTHIVNPGSVGQPRNGQLGAHWVLFDTVSRSFDFRQEEYDSSVLVEECQVRQPGVPYLADVLIGK